MVVDKGGEDSDDVVREGLPVLLTEALQPLSTHTDYV